MGHALSGWRARSLHRLIFWEDRRENANFCVKEGLKIIILLPKTLSEALLQLQVMMTLLRHLVLGHARKC